MTTRTHDLAKPGTGALTSRSATSPGFGAVQVAAQAWMTQAMPANVE